MTDSGSERSEYRAGESIVGPSVVVEDVLARGGPAVVYEVKNNLGKTLVAKVLCEGQARNRARAEPAL